MADDTRITAHPQPKDTRLAASLPSQPDTRICLLPKDDEPKQSFLRRFWMKSRRCWFSWAVLILNLFALLWSIHIRQTNLRKWKAFDEQNKQWQAETKRKQKEIDKMTRELDELQKEHDRLKQQAQPRK